MESVKKLGRQGLCFFGIGHQGTSWNQCLFNNGGSRQCCNPSRYLVAFNLLQRMAKRMAKRMASKFFQCSLSRFSFRARLQPQISLPSSNVVQARGLHESAAVCCGCLPRVLATLMRLRAGEERCPQLFHLFPSWQLSNISWAMLVFWSFGWHAWKLEGFVFLPWHILIIWIHLLR